MSELLSRIHAWAETQPEAIALCGSRVSISYAVLWQECQRLVTVLQASGHRCIACLMDNSPAWVVLDLACLEAEITLVPLPAFFTPAQMQHALHDAGASLLLSDTAAVLSGLMPDVKSQAFRAVLGQALWALPLAPVSTVAHPGIAKITYTSGTTGQAKGVCLSANSMLTVANALVERLQVYPGQRHLCVLPLAVLLENVAGVYSALLAGACCLLPSLQQLGWRGGAGFEATALLTLIQKLQVNSLILLPQLLQLCVAARRAGMAWPGSVSFVAVGGAPVAASLLREALILGMPVFEGYGLSEASSVVALNTPTCYKAGSVGKLLPHWTAQVEEDGELLLAGPLFNGYLNSDAALSRPYATGDLAYIDEDGFVFLQGRKKNCFITSFGRNVAPEWVECELTLQPLIRQVAVFGEARPFNVAVVVSEASDESVQQAIKLANQALPDYAQVGAWVRATEPFSLQNQQLTGTQRLRRAEILRVYQSQLDALYQREEMHHGIL